MKSSRYSMHWGIFPIVRMFHDHDIYCPRRHKYLTFSRHICTWKAGIACYADLAFLQRKQGAMTYSPHLPRNYGNCGAIGHWETIVVGSSYMRSELIRNGFPAKTIHVLAPAVSDFFPATCCVACGGFRVVRRDNWYGEKGWIPWYGPVALMRSKVMVHIVGDRQ